MNGHTTVRVSIGANGETIHTDRKGMDQVDTEIVQMELTGTSSIDGAVRLKSK